MSLEDTEGPDIIKEFDEDPHHVTLKPGEEHTIIHPHVDSEGRHHWGVTLFNYTERSNTFFFRHFGDDLAIAVVTKDG